MTIAVKIICDSISPDGIRLPTMQLRYPKFIHGEFMTHRVLSRNASSSRAIPVERLIQDVLDDPAMPVSWGKNQKGMQASEELGVDARQRAKSNWLFARDTAVAHARRMAQAGTHKQIVNRILEPFCHINVVVTSTEWANFYALRRDPDAQPEMRYLAERIWEAQNASVPTLLRPGQWHLPYYDEADKLESWNPGDDPIRISAARCARVSYTTHEGKPSTLDEDLDLYDRLLSKQPLHASPAEHQATPDIDITSIPGTVGRWMLPRLHGNFVGWRQYRKMLPNEYVADRP